MSSKTKTTATKEEARPALVPKLRFPGFQDAWEMIPIGEKVDLLSGYPFDGVEISQDSCGVRLLRGINITEGRIRHTPEIDRYYTGETDGLEKFRVRLNDLVIGMDGSKVGKNSSLISDDDADALLIQRVARLRTSSPTLIQFIFQQINSTTFHSYVDKINTSSGIPHISAKQIKDFTIGFPSPPEQQKIASCLSSVDELIAAQARYVAALKTHKKGLMQQLFPREGETKPRLRFPEFQNAGEWDETELGQLISIKGRIGYRGYTVADIVNAGEGAISLSPSNITASGVLGFDKATYITWAKYHESPEIMVERGQTLLVKTGSTFGKVAYVSDLPQECTVNPQIVVLKPHSIHPYFLFLLVFGEVIQTKIRAIVVGGAIPTLSQEAVSKFKIRVPTNAEQQRIASCLSSLDALITAETQKLEALKTHKKGLMQQLFPSPEEVEG